MGFRWKKRNLQKSPIKKEDYKKLISFCKKNNVEFLTSVFNLEDLFFVKKLKLKSIKIPSHEIYNLELIKAAIKNFNLVYLSAGCATESELKKITSLVKKNIKKICLMHCVSSYPLEFENVNLSKLEHFKKYTKNIGYVVKSINDAIAAM